MQSDEDPDNFLYKKDRCHDCLNSVIPKEGPSDHQYENIILQRLLPEYDRIGQTHFGRDNCDLADIRWMMSMMYADNLARSNSDLSRGIARRSVAMQATGRDLSNPNCHDVINNTLKLFFVRTTFLRTHKKNEFQSIFRIAITSAVYFWP